MRLMFFCFLILMTCVGCGVQSPTTGTLFTDTKGPVAATGLGPGSKTGKAEAKHVFLLFAWGDASIAQAAKNGGLTRVHRVDHEAFSILGVYGKFTTVVTGE